MKSTEDTIPARNIAFLVLLAAALVYGTFKDQTDSGDKENKPSTQIIEEGK